MPFPMKLHVIVANIEAVFNHLIKNKVVFEELCKVCSDYYRMTQEQRKKMIVPKKGEEKQSGGESKKTSEEKEPKKSAKRKLKETDEEEKERKSKEAAKEVAEILSFLERNPNWDEDDEDFINSVLYPSEMEQKKKKLR